MRTSMRKRTPRDWVVATRPWSLPASLIPVAATTAYLLHYTGQGNGGHHIACAITCLVVLVLFHAGGNLLGDCYDHMKKVDLPDSLNGVSWIYDGTFRPMEILRYGAVLIAIGCVIGLWTALHANVSLLLVGVVGGLLACSYPWFKAHRLGDVNILLCFAILPSLGQGLLVTGCWLWQTVAVSLTYGLLTVSILQANNTRDILNDSQAGISTLSMWLGGRLSQRLYVAEVVTAYLLVAALVCLGVMPILSLSVFLSTPLALRNCRQMLAAKPLADEPIATLDRKSAQVQLVFGILLTLSFTIEALL